MEKRTQSALQFLDITVENWKMSFEEAMKDPVVKARMEKEE